RPYLPVGAALGRAQQRAAPALVLQGPQPRRGRCLPPGRPAPRRTRRRRPRAAARLPSALLRRLCHRPGRQPARGGLSLALVPFASVARCFHGWRGAVVVLVRFSLSSFFMDGLARRASWAGLAVRAGHVARLGRATRRPRPPAGASLPPTGRPALPAPPRTHNGGMRRSAVMHCTLVWTTMLHVGLARRCQTPLAALPPICAADARGV